MSGWTTGLTDCCDDSSVCALGCFCPCILHYSSLKLAEGRDDCCRQIFCPMSPFNLRQVIRRRRNMEYDGCRDCIETTFCMPCAICQLNRELVYGNGLPLPGEGYMGSIPKVKTTVSTANLNSGVVIVNNSQVTSFTPPRPPPPPSGFAPPPRSLPPQPHANSTTNVHFIMPPPIDERPQTVYEIPVEDSPPPKPTTFESPVKEESESSSSSSSSSSK